MPRFALLLLFLVGGCSTPSYRPLPGPDAPETPSINPPLDIRQANWTSNNQGSCVHASLSSMLHWQNHFDLAKWWRSQYGGGEYSDQLRRRLDAAKVPYAFTERANLQLLDDAHAARRGALMWWKPYHCCLFCGWVKGSDGRVYAAILDNNRVQSYEFVERGQFHKDWAGYGGFALMVLFDPPSLPPWKSYELIEE